MLVTTSLWSGISVNTTPYDYDYCDPGAFLSKDHLDICLERAGKRPLMLQFLPGTIKDVEKSLGMIRDNLSLCEAIDFRSPHYVQVEFTKFKLYKSPEDLSRVRFLRLDARGSRKLLRTELDFTHATLLDSLWINRLFVSNDKDDWRSIPAPYKYTFPHNSRIRRLHLQGDIEAQNSIDAIHSSRETLESLEWILSASAVLPESHINPNLPKLTHLKLKGSVPSTVFKDFSAPSLTHFHISATDHSIPSIFFNHSAFFPSLSHFHVVMPSISLNGHPALVRFIRMHSSLEAIELNHVILSEEWVDALSQEVLPGLRHLGVTVVYSGQVYQVEHAKDLLLRRSKQEDGGVSHAAGHNNTRTGSFKLYCLGSFNPSLVARKSSLRAFANEFPDNVRVVGNMRPKDIETDRGWEWGEIFGM